MAETEHADEKAAVGNTGNERWCFSWFAAQPVPEGATAASRPRAALQKNAKWKKGDRITVAFLEGDQELRRRVRETAKQWVAQDAANLTLDFVDGTDAMIRIAFRQGDGSWSTVGTTCRQVPKGQPTMNYGWIDAGSDEEELRAVVLHEFGHALGLVHEHQNPAGGIKWDRDAVVRDLSQPPNSWSLDVIEFNMFVAHAKDETNFSALDRQSIMMYPIPKHWTMNGFSVGFNTELSATDKKFIRQQYP